MTTTTTEAQFVEHEERSRISQADAERLLGLKDRQTIRVLREEGVKGIKIKGKGNKNWYFKDEVQAVAARRGSGTGKQPVEHERDVYKGGIAAYQEQQKSLIAVNANAISRIEKLSVDLGKAQAEAKQAEQYKRDRDKLVKEQEADKKLIEQQRQAIFNQKVALTSKEAIAKNKAVFLALSIFVGLLIWLWTTPLLARIVEPLFALIFQAS